MNVNDYMKIKSHSKLKKDETHEKSQEKFSISN